MSMNLDTIYFDLIKQRKKMYEAFPHSTGTFKTGAKKYGVLRMKFKLL